MDKLSYRRALSYVDDGMSSCDRIASFLTSLADREETFANDIAKVTHTTFISINRSSVLPLIAASFSFHSSDNPITVSW
jgi:hypothetical protein